MKKRSRAEISAIAAEKQAVKGAKVDEVERAQVAVEQREEVGARVIAAIEDAIDEDQAADEEYIQTMERGPVSEDEAEDSMSHANDVDMEVEEGEREAEDLSMALQLKANVRQLCRITGC
jgi:hypothetical protein